MTEAKRASWKTDGANDDWSIEDLLADWIFDEARGVEDANAMEAELRDNSLPPITMTWITAHFRVRQL